MFAELIWDRNSDDPGWFVRIVADDNVIDTYNPSSRGLRCKEIASSTARTIIREALSWENGAGVKITDSDELVQITDDALERWEQEYR